MNPVPVDIPVVAADALEAQLHLQHREQQFQRAQAGEKNQPDNEADHHQQGFAGATFLSPGGVRQGRGGGMATTLGESLTVLRLDDPLN